MTRRLFFGLLAGTPLAELVPTCLPLPNDASDDLPGRAIG